MPTDWFELIFPGGMALAIIGGAFAILRYVPGLVIEALRRLFMTTITTRDNSLVQWLMIWIGQTEYGQNARWLDGVLLHESEELEAKVTPGIGAHTFIYKGRRYWLNLHLEEAGVAGLRVVLSLSTIGRNRDSLNEVLAATLALANAERVGRNAVYVNDKWGTWNNVRLFRQRPPSSVFLDPGLADKIIADAGRFWAKPGWYVHRGLPHRRGYLLYGPPGNGKSTIVQMIATAHGAAIHALTLTDEEITDHTLAMAVGRLPQRSILLIEDVEKLDMSRTGVTLSGLLNAIDGPLASDGRLLIATANEINDLSAPFMREGRLDRKWYIGTPSQEAFEACADAFGLNGQAPIAEALDKGWSMARFQQELLQATES